MRSLRGSADGNRGFFFIEDDVALSDREVAVQGCQGDSHCAGVRREVREQFRGTQGPARVWRAGRIMNKPWQDLSST